MSDDLALFVRDGDTYVPTERAVGPWDPNALHGGPPAALLVGAVESHDSEPGAFHVARVTVEIFRPVPVTPLTLTARTIRPGKKVQVVEAALLAGGRELVRATAVRIRVGDVRLDVDYSEPEPPRFPDRDAARPVSGWSGFHNRGVTMRHAVGSFVDLGPATVWIRLNQPVVAGAEPTPLQRVAAAADFGNGVSKLRPFQEVMSINPELTIYLHRMPDGEWVCLDARTQLSDRGYGLADSVLYDRRGRIGRALQALYVESR